MKTVNLNWRKLAETPNILSTLIKISLFIAFLVVIFFQDFGQVFSLAIGNSEVQYILIVPFVAAFFFYKSRKAFLFSSKSSHLQDLIGAGTCLLALLIYIYGSYSLFPIEMHLLTLPIFAAGLILLLFGTNTLKTLIFPTTLLIFVSPFPIIFSDQFGGTFINSTTTASASFLKVFLPIDFSLRPTALISLVTNAGQKITFQIAPACSGIYSIISLSFFAIIFLYIVSGPIWKKILFASLSILAAFLLNILRIVLTVTLGYSLGYGVAVEFFHDFAGIGLTFFGAILLIGIGDKFLKLSFLQQKAPICTHPNQTTEVCHQCGKVLKFAKNHLNVKRLGAICLFLLIVMALSLQASAATFNKASNDKNNGIYLDLNSGNTTAFSGLTGWSAQFIGTENDAENQLGLKYVGDYVLNSASGKQINAILEVSDAQSKFHTWEGCLNYQSTPTTIVKTNYLTLYDQNNTIINAENMIAEIPSYNEKLLLLYWFDSANIKINDTMSPWALKLTIYETVDTQVNTTESNAELMQLGTQIENSWNQYKNPTAGFSADIYRNITPAFLILTVLLISSIMLLFAKFTLTSKTIAKKTLQLPEEDQQLIKNLTTPKKSQEITPQLTCPPIQEDKLKALQQTGFLKEKYTLRNNEPYITWRNPLKQLLENP